MTVKSYGLMMVIGFLLAVSSIRHLSRNITPDPQLITNAALYSLIGGVAGARLFFVIHHLDNFQEHPLEVFAIWQGGLELYGGIILALTIIYCYLRYHKLPIRRYFDILAIGLMLALVFGRIGCFLNGCCFGKPTELPWAVRFPYASFAYRSQVNANFPRNRPAPQLQLPAEYFSYYEKFFNIDLEFQSELNSRIISRDLRSKFKNNRVLLSRYARISTKQKGQKWLITNIEDKYTATKYEAKIEVYGKILSLKPNKDLTEQQKIEVTTGKYRCLPVHPTQLYSSASAAVLCLVLYLFWRKSQKAGKILTKHGSTFSLMFILYGFNRFFMECLRDDNPFEFDGLTISQNISIAMIILGAVLIVIFQRIKAKTPKS